jgi:ATP-dependent DNA helicase DinG
VPAGFPKPNDPGHPTAWPRLAARCARTLGGRTFVLTTTLRALQAIGDALTANSRSTAMTIFRCCVQGQLPKRQLMQQFLADPRSVLVGSQSFLGGHRRARRRAAVRPHRQAAVSAAERPAGRGARETPRGEGRNAFADYFVAEAAVSLKQGAGR